MIADFWNNTLLMKRYYDRVMDPVAERFQITRMELDILLFLANNPSADTAADIIERRQLTKSHISSSVKNLVNRGLLGRVYRDGNRKLVHLTVEPAAAAMVEAGRQAQRAFFAALFRGFEVGELAEMEAFQGRMGENLRRAIREIG